jgi:hypothetical protein
VLLLLLVAEKLKEELLVKLLEDMVVKRAMSCCW